MHSPGQARPDDYPDEAGEVAPLGRQDRADEGSGAGDGGEMLAEQDQPGNGVVIDPVLKPVRGGGPPVAEDGNLGGQKGAVIAVGDGKGGQGADEQPD